MLLYQFNLYTFCLILLRNVECGGIRTAVRTITSIPLPPVIIIEASDLVRTRYLPPTIRQYPEHLTVCVVPRQYRLAGATMHAGDHFVGLVYSVKHGGWLYYDGLAGKLVRYRSELHERAVLENLVYVKIAN
jgi:hypothetical protein